MIRSGRAEGPVSLKPDGAAQPRVWLWDAFSFTPWYTSELATAIGAAGAKVRLVCNELRREPDYFTEHDLKPSGGPLRLGRLADQCPKTLRSGIRLAEAIANIEAIVLGLRLGRTTRPDVIHLQQVPMLNHGFRSDLRLIAEAQRARIPVIHTVHNILPHHQGEKSRPLYAELYRRVDHLICHSESACERLHTEFNIPTEKITVVPHGPLFAINRTPTSFDRQTSRTRLSLPLGRPIVLCQGILAEYKGVDVLLDAWKLCMLRWRNRYGPCPLLLIAGTGSTAVEAKIRQAEQASEGTILADLRYIRSSEIPQYYMAADILVYPYRAITTSGALLTGLSYGRPIIASDLAPFREYLVHGQNALLAEPGDAVDLASSLFRLLLGLSEGPCLRADSEHQMTYRLMALQAADNPARMTGWAEIGRRTVHVYRERIGSVRNS